MLVRSHVRSLPCSVVLIALAACASAPSGQPAQRAADSSVAAEIPRRLPGEEASAYLRRAAASGFAGEVLAAVGDFVVLHAAYGLAAPATAAPYDTTKPTYIGSLTKQFTAAAVLRLAEEGRLTLGDSLGRFFDAVPADKRDVTIRELLTHTAGIPDTIGDRYGSTFLTRDEFVRRVLAAPLDSSRGTFSYSTSGYALLAAIVERASGERYEDYLEHHLLDRAGMTHTGYALPPTLMRRAAHAVKAGADLGAPQNRPTWTSDGPTWALRGGGGMMSTSGDLFRWFRALKRGAVLTPESVAQLFASQVPEDSTHESFYGYGWFIVPGSAHGKVIGHNGSDGTFYGTLVNFATRDVTVIVLTNAQPPGFRRVEGGLIAAVYDALAKSDHR
jgi:CubicO group peptidase (beta-lactamase class C family)